MGRLRRLWRDLLAWKHYGDVCSLSARPRMRAVPRARVRMTWLAKMQGLDEAGIELLRELASNGEAFEQLTQHPSWGRLLELKEELQAVATEQARGPSSSAEQRRDGATAYWALEGLFGAVYRTIANGQKARMAVRETVKVEKR